ncbi:MAG: OmpA family protein [Chitinophagales bacterium]
MTTIKIFLTTCLLAIVAFGNAQDDLVKHGDKAMHGYHFDKAAALFKKAVDHDPKNVVAMEKLGTAFRMAGDFTSAEAIYKVLASNPVANPVTKFYYGQVLSINGKYKEADSAFQAYALAVPNDSRSTEFRNYLDKIRIIAQDTKVYELTNLPENSELSEIGPAYWLGQLTFSSNRSVGSAVKHVDMWSGKGYYDIYVLQSADKAIVMEPAKAKGKLNSRLNDGPATYSVDGSEVIFTRTAKKKGPDGYKKLGLYRATWTEKKGWSKPQPLSFSSNAYNFAHPSLSKDGKRLYFISDMPGGLGETDVYVAVRNGNDWEAPVNLGKEINTSGSEMFPFISSDGMLYFASDSRVGLGGLDIYAADATGNKFSNVRNLGAPVNTNADDFGFINDDTQKNGFIVSDRPGGLGSDDIYRFVKKAESVCGVVADAKTKKELESVTITALSGNSVKAGVNTNMKGNFCLQLTPEQDYKIKAEKDGYAAYETNVHVKANKNDQVMIYLEPKGGIELKVDVSQKGDGKIEGAQAFVINKATGEVIEGKSDSNGIVKFDLFKDQDYELKVVKKLQGQDGVYDKFVKTISTMGFTPSQTLNENAQLTYYDGKYVFDLPEVFFDLNSYKLNEKAKKGLDKVIEVMKIFPDMQVEMSAHTDSRGNSAYNLSLSAMRANSCVEYIESQGIDKKRLIAIGYGELKIRNKCFDDVPCTEKEHSVNRRTEFRVVKFD